MPIPFQAKTKELHGSFFVPSLTQEEHDYLSAQGFYGNATRVDTRTRWHTDSERYHRMSLYRPGEVTVGASLGIRLLAKSAKGQQLYKLILIPVSERDFTDAPQGTLWEAMDWVVAQCGGWSW